MSAGRPGARRRLRVLHVLVAAALIGGAGTAHAVPGYDAVRRDFRSSDWLLLARDGTPLQRTRIDSAERRGDWVTLADVSPALRAAIVVSEDKRFYDHSGVDWRGIAGAAWANLWNSRTRGASTVTMQLAGLLGDSSRRSGQRSLPQKAGQAIDALWLERSWRKDQILEAYLNLVPFRGETVGLSALSVTLFGKAPSGLDERESAVAAALIRAPNASYPKVAERACRILHDMQAAAGCTGLDGLVQLAFARPAPPSSAFLGGEALAPHFARRIAAETHPEPGARIRSTLDAGLQRFARDALTHALTELSAAPRSRNVQDGAAIVIDNRSGDILAWVGSSGALSAAPEVDSVLALRQAGSTLKPFLYAQAIDERRLTGATLLDDSPVDLAAGGGLYVPQNYDHDFKGWVSVRSALGSSLNVPAVRTLVLVTPHRFSRTLTALGLPLTEQGDYYGYSLALGSADVTLLTLANAYRALANGGLARPAFDLPRSAAQVAAQAPAKRVFSADASFIVTDMLADNNARTRTFGFDSPLATHVFSAVKTGTSKDMRDNWAVGYTSRYTVGVWVGNADGSPMWNVSGVTGAAPVWAAIVARLHRDGGSVAPKPPPGVVSERVAFERAIEPSRDEWFLRGTETAEVKLAAGAGGTPARASVTAPAARRDGTGPLRNVAATAGATGPHAPLAIASPTDGTIFALDPDIPPRNQRVWFERVSGDSGRGSWRLDGRTIGRGERVAWLPWPGHHRLELLDASGKPADQVGFEVRGAVARPGAAGRSGP
ncbi:penicillin-binding protein 1C [Burkholderia sp. 22PA0106]|uniref:penicillin-binding protein 1C n=1 Tax=Burkholderia sp. 22PA0106 TaxID=3237371 RepID=UPI0039C430A4